MASVAGGGYLARSAPSSCCPPPVDLACCRSDQAWRFRCIAVHSSRRPACRDHANLLRQVPVLPDDPGAAHHLAPRPTWQQETLLLGHAGTHHFTLGTKREKAAILFPDALAFFEEPLGG